MTPTQEDREAVERLPLTQGSAKQVLLQAFMRHRLAAEERVARMALEAAAVKLEKAISNGYTPPVLKTDKCEHGRFGWEDCVGCYDDALSECATAIRQIDPASLGAE